MAQETIVEFYGVQVPVVHETVLPSGNDEPQSRDTTTGEPPEQVMVAVPSLLSGT